MTTAGGYGRFSAFSTSVFLPLVAMVYSGLAGPAPYETGIAPEKDRPRLRAGRRPFTRVAGERTLLDVDAPVGLLLQALEQGSQGVSKSGIASFVTVDAIA